MKRLKICLLSYRGNPYCGGQGVYLSYLARELAKLGHNVKVFVGPPYPISMDGADVHRIENHNFFGYKSRTIFKRVSPRELASPLHLFEYATSRIGVFPEIFAFSIRAFSQLKRILEYESFDIIHDNQCLGYGFLLMKAFRIPLISTIHHPLTVDRTASFEIQPILRKRIKLLFYYPILMQKIVSRHMDRIITVSYNASREITRAFGIPQEKIRVVYNGLDSEIFKPIRGIQKKANNLIFVGNTGDVKKGLIYLLEALSLLDKEVTLTIVDGGTPARFSTEQLVKALNLQHRVSITCKLETDQLVRQYAEAEVAVVPSLYEGFGFPAAEAMACTLPTVATKAGALPEVVGENGNTGLLVPPRDPLALAKAIRTLLNNREMRRRMGKAARQRIIKHFTWAGFGKQIENIYQEVVSAYH